MGRAYKDQRPEVDARALGANCDACPLAGTCNPVPPETHFDPELIILAESPGSTEVDKGRPLVGEIGHLFDKMLEAMRRAGAEQLTPREVETFTKNAIIQVGEGEHRHPAPSKDFLGQDAAVLAKGAGRSVSDKCELLFAETDYSNPFVSVEQMMPFVPFVRVRDIDEGIAKAKEAEHGFRHTSIIHSHNVRNMTRMGRALDTTLFVKNGPCMAALGLGGEGYLSFSIAGPTGEGVTTPLTFTRERRCSMIDDLRILGR